jgi:hypothetical protein
MPASRSGQIFDQKRPEPAIFFSQKANEKAKILVEKANFLVKRPEKGQIFLKHARKRPYALGKLILQGFV